MGDKLFYAAAAGFVAGVFVRSFIDFGAAFSVFLLLVGGILFFVCFAKSFLKFERMFCSTSPLLISVFLIATALGMFRYDIADRAGPRSALDASLGQTVVLEGVVADEPDVRERVARLVLKTEETKILVTASLEPRYAYGDRITVRGKLERPENFRDEKTLRTVYYISHLAKDGIHYEMFLPRIEIVARGEGNSVVETLFAFKNAFIGRLNAMLPEPHAGLLAGLVVGAKQSLGKELLDDFRTVGIIHIVVLSGYNITIIARFIEWLCAALSRNRRLIIAAGAMILFAIMVGASATVVRATIMALIVVLARGTGRLAAASRALLIAGLVMLIHNPQILVFDLSFQLSFLATVGLIYFAPLIEPRVAWITRRVLLREIVVATVATQLFVLPFLLYTTGLFSLVSLPVNLLILAAIPFTMLFGFLAGAFSFVWSVLALPFAYLAYALLAYELAVVDYFARLPFAAITLASFPAWFALLWYAAYGVVVWKFQKSSPHPPPLEKEGEKGDGFIPSPS